MCMPDVEDMSHLSMCLHKTQKWPHGKLTVLLHIVFKIAFSPVVKRYVINSSVLQRLH